MKTIFQSFTLGAILSISSLGFAASDIQSLLAQQHSSSRGKIGTSQCAAEFSRNTATLRNIVAEGNVLADMTMNGKEIIEASFRQRLDLLKVLKETTLSKGKVSGDCEKAFRKYVNARRLFEEYTALNANLNESPEIFEGNSPNLLVNPNYGKFALKSGDILVSRGTAVVSATIAKIGDQEGMYSHAAMVYVDPKTSDIYLMQSEIETGVEAELIGENYLRDGKIRANVYRPKDAKLAANAAKWMFDYIASVKAKGSYIRYNFSMDFSKEDLMFCSQMPFMAYQKASDNKFLLGATYKTTFVERKNRSFLNGLKITVPSTYSPNDVELDEKLELVAEWRDLSRAGKAHRRDAVMDSIFTWMDEEGYNFNKAYNSLESTLLVGLRNAPITGKFLSSSIADNIEQQQLKYFLTMNTIGGAALESYVEKEEALYKDAIPSYAQMLRLMVEVKKDDLNRLAQEREYNENGLTYPATYESRFMKYLSR
ncbi:MAG TPA: hypothetical protein VGE46_10810 [Bdellovibrio sp.]